MIEPDQITVKNIKITLIYTIILIIIRFLQSI